MNRQPPTAERSDTGWADGLIELLDRQRGVYGRLHELTGRQARLVEAGETEPLLELLARRQALIDELTQLNTRIEPYKRSWASLWPQLTDETQRRVRGLIDRVQGLLDEIVAQDEKDRASLSAQRNEAGAGLRQVRAGSAVNRAYGRPGGEGNESRYTDQRG